MKTTIFNCNGYVITIDVGAEGWNVKTSGNVPKPVQKQIDELMANKPKPVFQMAYCVIKGAVKNDLNYIA